MHRSMSDVEALLSVDSGKVPPGVVAFFARDPEASKRRVLAAFAVVMAAVTAAGYWAALNRPSIALLALATLALIIQALPPERDPETVPLQAADPGGDAQRRHGPRRVRACAARTSTSWSTCAPTCTGSASCCCWPGTAAAVRRHLSSSRGETGDRGHRPPSQAARSLSRPSSAFSERDGEPGVRADVQIRHVPLPSLPHTPMSAIGPRVNSRWGRAAATMRPSTVTATADWLSSCA